MVRSFYDRTGELSTLKDKYEHLKAGELLVIYGRRRVGKTELIKTFMNDIPKSGKLYFYVDLVSRQGALDSLSLAIQEQLGETLRFANFDSFFEFVESKSKSKFLLAIDEFQRFLDVAPEFITKLQNAWDSRLRHNKIMILLVGSSIGMMQRITSSKAGALYGRSAKMKLSPFRYADFRLMFKELDEEEKIRRYSVFGGTPYYLDKVKGIPDTLQAITDLVLNKSSPLYEEPKNLLEYENVRVHAKYNSILHAVASGKEVLKEIQDTTKISATTIPAYISRLDELLDLLERNDPVFGKERLGRYAIRDNFFKFWYRFVFPNQTALNLGNQKLVSKIIEDNLNGYIGKVFEGIAKELLILYQNKTVKGKRISFDRIGAWWDRNGNEIDIIAHNSKESKVLAGEVKWTNEPCDIQVVNSLMEKIKLLNFNGTIELIFISKNGFTQSCLAKIEELNALHLDLTDISKLFEEGLHS
jgi:uncharacterized protein